MIGRSPDIARRIAGRKAALVNTVQSFPIVKQVMMKMMGMDLRRDLPSYATKTWTKSIKKLNTRTTNPDIILLVDTYTPVSYTHLDVYKRQLYWSGLLNL